MNNKDNKTNINTGIFQMDIDFQAKTLSRVWIKKIEINPTRA
jgi:hypothetical protein